MNLASNIHPIPLLFKPYMLLIKPKAFVFWGHIFFSKPILDDLSSAHPKPLYVSYLVHEHIHVQRQKATGRMHWSLYYQFNKRFRLTEELAAYKGQFNYLKRHQQTYDLEQLSRSLSGFPYFWCTSYSEAKKLIYKLWQEA